VTTHILDVSFAAKIENIQLAREERWNACAPLL